MKKFFILLLLTSCCLSGCAGVRLGRDVEFQDAERFAGEKKIPEALAVYEKIAKESPGSDRGANALFASASLHIFYDNPLKNYALALQEFDEFLRLYPDNDNADEARNWHAALTLLLELKKENEHLTSSIEQLNRLDIRHEEKRKGK